jgi:hypothetical protein
MISTRALTALALIAAFAILAPPARAQYMYLDANGNGVHDSGDHLAVTGTATTVDVWIVTDHNRDGSLATCDVDPGSALSIESYVVNLQASGGTVSYSGFINRFTGATIAFGELNPGDGRYKNGFGRGAIGALPPGTYRLCTLSIMGVSGTPRVDIVDRVSGSLDFTQFASPGGCFGNDFDNVLKLTGPNGGSDWTDVDGLDPAPVTCLSALAFTIGGNKQVNLQSGNGTCAQIEPAGGAFAIESVNLASIVMRSTGTGSVEEIHAVGSKTSLNGDRNGDGIAEITACFSRGDLQLLFSNLTGTQAVQVVLQGDVAGGGRFCTTLQLTVKAGNGGALAASIRPNPLNPSAVLSFTTRERGTLLVQLFDVRGRLVRTLREESDAAAGAHDVTIDGTAANGARLGSGIYYVRVRAGAVEERATITILK